MYMSNFTFDKKEFINDVIYFRDLKKKLKKKYVGFFDVDPFYEEHLTEDIFNYVSEGLNVELIIKENNQFCKKEAKVILNDLTLYCFSQKQTNYKELYEESLNEIKKIKGDA